MTRNCTKHSLLTVISLPLVTRCLEPEPGRTDRIGAQKWRKGKPRQAISLFSQCRSAEGVPTRAASAGVRVVDREALLLQGVLEVDVGAVQVRDAHLVDDDLDAVEVDGDVAVEQALVEVELVDEAGASARLHGNPKAEVVATFLFVERAHLGCRVLGEHYSVCRCRLGVSQCVRHDHSSSFSESFSQCTPGHWS